jgi:hypothetical protein
MFQEKLLSCIKNDKILPQNLSHKTQCQPEAPNTFRHVFFAWLGEQRKSRGPGRRSGSWQQNVNTFSN